MGKTLLPLGLILLSCTITPGPTCPVTLINGLGGWSIHYVQFARSGGDPWGPDLLDAREILRPGASRTFLVPPGTWDIRVTDNDGDVYLQRNVPLTEEGYTWTVTLDHMHNTHSPNDFSGNCPVTCVNRLSRPIDSLWVTPQGNTHRGTSLLHSPLPPDGEYILWVRPGDYDLRASDGIGKTFAVYQARVTENGFYWEITRDDLEQ